MKNTFGSSVSVTLFGESHGKAVGAVLDGIAPGITVDDEFIRAQMEKRRSLGEISTPRKESDEIRIISGVFNGKTTGTPITVLIENQNTKSADYSQRRTVVRPGHADYTAYEKYHGYSDPRGGGHFSGRITAGLVATGAIALDALRKKGIYVATYIKRLAKISDRDFDFERIDEDICELDQKSFGVLDDTAAEQMISEVKNAQRDGDSVGGILESCIVGLPSGVGEPWFDTLEGVLSHILFSIPAIKGVEFGDGFALADMRGSESNDEFCISDGEVITKTNRMGGILGGISNAMPITVRCAVKPTPSIFKEQNTVDIDRMENTPLSIKGRHDPAVVHRARVVVDSAIALALADMLALRIGTDWLSEVEK